MSRKPRYYLTAAEVEEAELWAADVSEAMTTTIDLSGWLNSAPRWSCGRCHAQTRAWPREGGDAPTGWGWEGGALRCPACRAERAAQRKASR